MNTTQTQKLKEIKLSINDLKIEAAIDELHKEVQEWPAPTLLITFLVEALKYFIKRKGYTGFRNKELANYINKNSVKSIINLLYKD